MFTLPCSKYNPIKVTLQNGQTILARITRFDPVTGRVCWIDKNEQWKGTTHATKVVKGTPEEVVKWANERDAKIAPLDPIMAGWTLGKTKRGPMMMEGYYFSVPVLLNGKKVGEIIDQGDGGCVVTTVCAAFHNACDKWAQANGADGSYSSGVEHFWSWWDDSRTKGIDAKTHFANEREEMLKYTGTMSA